MENITVCIVFMYRKINFCLIELKFGVKLPRSQDGVEMWDFEKKKQNLTCIDYIDMRQTIGRCSVFISPHIVVVA